MLGNELCQRKKIVPSLSLPVVEEEVLLCQQRMYFLKTTHFEKFLALISPPNESSILNFRIFEKEILITQYHTWYIIHFAPRQSLINKSSSP
jgi:hypothetical protein